MGLLSGIEVEGTAAVAQGEDEPGDVPGTAGGARVASVSCCSGRAGRGGPACAGWLAVAAVDAGRRGRQAAAAGPGPQPLHLLGGGDGHRHDVVRRLRQRHVQQRRQPAARLDLGPGPGGVVGPGLAVGDAELPAVQLPDGVLLLAASGRSRKNTPSKRSARANSGGSLLMSLAVPTKNTSRLVVATARSAACRTAGWRRRCRPGRRRPPGAFSSSSTNRTHGLMASAICSAWRTFASRRPDQAARTAHPTSSSSVGRPVSLPSALAKALLPSPGHAQEQHAAGLDALGRAAGRGGRSP